MSIPCNCCPTEITRCRYDYIACTAAPTIVQGSTTSPVPNQSVVVANPNGFGIQNIAATADGNTAGGSYGGITTGLGNAINVVIEYRWTTAVDRAVQIRLWNNGGGNVNDFDGIGTALATILDGNANVLWQGNLVAGNGGAIFVTELNGVSLANQINGIRVLRLSNITNLPGAAAPDILWRNIDFRLTYVATMTWVCPQGTVVADIVGVNSGITLGAGTLTQTNGPHTLTFRSNKVFNATIVTNRPANFSTLTVTNGTVLTITGNQINNFVLNPQFRDDQSATPVFGMLCNGVMTWYDSNGNPVAAANIEDCNI